MCPVLIRIIWGAEAKPGQALRPPPAAPGHTPTLPRLCLLAPVRSGVPGTYFEKLLFVFSKHVDHQQE